MLVRFNLHIYENGALSQELPTTPIFRLGVPAHVRLDINALFEWINKNPVL